MPGLLVIGESHLAARLGELSRKVDTEAALLPLGSLAPQVAEAWAGRALPPRGADDPGLFAGVDLATLTAVILCAEADEVNLALALRIRDADASVRLVISFFNYRLGHKIAQELGRCTVLSAAEVSAPGFVAAAIHGGVIASVIHGGESFCFVADDARLAEETLAAPGVRFLPTARLRDRIESRPPAPRTGDGIPTPWRRGIDRYLLGILGLIAAALGAATWYFHCSQGLGWLSSLYFVVTTFCTVGYGDYSLKDASEVAKVAGIVLMLASVTLTACLFAIVTNALIQKRIDAREGRRRFRLRDHVIVCGLGRTGLLVAEGIRALGLQVLVIDRDRANPLLEELSRKKIPFMVSEATRETALVDANVRGAASLVCAINDDLLGLEIGLLARTLRPDIHLVLRVFDGVLADRVQRHFHIHTALSTSSLAAPAFLAAAIHPRASTLLELGGAWHLVSRGDDDGLVLTRLTARDCAGHPALPAEGATNHA